MFTKGFLSAWLSLVTLLPIIPQHKLDQTKEHLLWQYITTSQKHKQKKNKKKTKDSLNQTQEVQLCGKKNNKYNIYDEK